MRPRLFGYARPVLGRHPAAGSSSSSWRAFPTPRRRAAFIAVSAAAIACLVAGPGSVVLGASAGRPSPALDSIRVLVDPRTELMSIVFRLAESAEYSQGAVAAYNEAVDARFGKFKGHAVVRRARRLRETRGISYNAPMSLAVHLTPGPVRFSAHVKAAAGPDESPAAPSHPSALAIELAERVPLDPLPGAVDERWTTADARAFLTDLRSFVRETRYAEFLAARRPFYEAATAGLEKVIRETRVVEWLHGFFGAGGAGGAAGANGRPPADQPRTDFIVSIGLLNGGGSYGASVNFADGRREVYSILGAWNIDASGAPRFPPWISSTIVHEFCHSYVNPLVDAHERALADAGRRIYRLVENEMRKQAYGSWRTMMCESIVRACSVLYTHDVLGAEAADRELAMNRDRRFLWVGRLADLLGTYQKSREAYPTLGDFFPRIAAFFENYARANAAAAELALLYEEKAAGIRLLSRLSPKIISMSPPNGVRDVDAAEVDRIVVAFDRPMRAGALALITVPGLEFPRGGEGPPAFDATQTVLTIPCRLKPGTDYGFSMNSDELLVMADNQGNALVPTLYRFSTSAAGGAAGVRPGQASDKK